MIFEALPNELLLELFGLLDATDLFRAFKGLNNRFNTLIFIHLRVFHVDFDFMRNYHADKYLMQHLPSISNRIISLRLWHNDNDKPSQIDLFFSYGLQMNQFINLRSISLCYFTCDVILRKILVDCHQLPHLSYLKIINHFSEYMQSLDFSNTIWNLTKLTDFHLNMGEEFHVPTMISSSLQNISISSLSFGLNQILGIFQQTPFLQRLHLHLNKLNDNYHQILPSVPSITILKLSDVRSWHTMVNILKVTPNLTHLKVDAYDINCNGNQWEELIDNYLPKLKIFRFKIYIHLYGKDNNEQYVTNLINSFRTKFWLEKHRWFVHCCPELSLDYECILFHTIPNNALIDFNVNKLQTIYLANIDYHLYCKFSLFEDWYFSYFQSSISRNSNAFIHRIDLRYYPGIFFSKKECINFIHLPEIKQCEELLIKVKSRKSIIYLINKMHHLRMLNIQWEGVRKSSSIISHNKSEMEVLFKWVKEHLPSTCVIKNSNFSRLTLWIDIEQS